MIQLSIGATELSQAQIQKLLQTDKAIAIQKLTLISLQSLCQVREGLNSKMR
jgi:hypothetical protein